MTKNRKSYFFLNVTVEKTDFGFGGTPPPNPKFETPETWGPCRDPRATPSGRQISGVDFIVFEKIGKNEFFSNPHIFETGSSIPELLTWVDS